MDVPAGKSDVGDCALVAVVVGVIGEPSSPQADNTPAAKSTHPQFPECMDARIALVRSESLMGSTTGVRQRRTRST